MSQQATWFWDYMLWLFLSFFLVGAVNEKDRKKLYLVYVTFRIAKNSFNDWNNQNFNKKYINPMDILGEPSLYIITFGRTVNVLRQYLHGLHK
jgi:hypothetical protein